VTDRRGDPPIPPAAAVRSDDKAVRRFPLARAVTPPLPSSGSRFRDAMVSCGHGGTLARFQTLNLRTVLPRGTVGALTEGERSALDALQNALESNLLTLLRYGYVRATAFLPGSPEAVPVPAGWWDGASVDRVANTATAHGTTLPGLLIYAGEGAAAEDQAAVVLEPPSGSVSEAPPVAPTGCPGRPPVRYTLKEEMERRHGDKKMLLTLEAEVAYLCAWYNKMFKEGQRANETSQRNALRKTYKELKAKTR
jgi:hypothetical protein